LLSYRPTTSISETSSPLIRIARRNEAESVRLRVQQQRESVVCVPPVLGELANREPTKTHPLPATNPILPPRRHLRAVYSIPLVASLLGQLETLPLPFYPSHKQIRGFLYKLLSSSSVPAHHLLNVWIDSK
jgi:hypothetical protein